MALNAGIGIVGTIVNENETGSSLARVLEGVIEATVKPTVVRLHI